MTDNNRTIYKVGEEIKLFITLRNGNNVSRSQGGDHLRVRIFNEHLNAYAAGHVLDHNNGSYTAVLRAIWPGKQTISLALLFRRETIRAIYYIRREVTSTLQTSKLKIADFVNSIDPDEAAHCS